MNGSANLARAQLLLQQGRYDMAETELRRALAENPQDETAHALLAICLANAEKFDAAVAAGQQAVGLGPDYSFCHYALGYALYRRDFHASQKQTLFSTRREFKEAEASVMEAIRLAPHEATAFSLLSSIRLARRDWKGALEAAEQGLAIDPQEVGCINDRATALTHLGRREEAGQTMDYALSEAPEDSHTHANMGWMLLHQRQPKEALEHFKEALRLDPTNEHAQAGIVEALKARNFIYRWMLAYFLWMSRLSAGAQWGMVLGGYFLIRFLGSASRKNPELEPYVIPIQILYTLFVILSWTAPHLFNLMLRLDKFGRYVLSRDQILGANLVGACLLVGFASIGAALVLDRGLLLLAGLGCIALMIPVGGTFTRQGKARWVLGIYTLVLIGVGLAALTLAFLSQRQMAGTLGGLFALGLFIFGWIANAMATR